MHSVIIELHDKNDINKLSIITQSECIFNCEVNCSMEHVLCRQIGIPKDYFDSRVQTIFLNGNVVDNCCDDIVSDKDRIALSAAMPGLVGSILRKRGCLSSMRSSISLNLFSRECTGTIKGSITLKLFNLISKEIGPSLLFSGKIIMNTVNLISMLKILMKNHPNIIKTLLFDGIEAGNKSIELDIKRPLCKNSVFKVLKN